MKKIWAIACRDFRTYFTSPIAYIVSGGFLAIMGFMFFNILNYFAQENARFQYMGRSMNITDGVIKPLYGNMNVVLLFLIPFVTMRLFAEEKKSHTIELLMTSPVTIWEMVLGKFLASTMLILLMLGVASVYPITLVLTGSPEMGIVLSSYLGVILMALCYLSVGILFSAVTENQIVAGALTFASLLLLWIINWGSQSAGPVISDILDNISLINHYNNFSQGLISTADVFYFISFIGLWLFLTHRVLDSYRWR